jgi:type I restriction enzyme S subunit
MKAGWEIKTLDELASIKTGKRDANHQDENGIYPFYTCAVGQFKSSTWAFDGASIILPGNGANVGKTFFYNGKFEAYQRTYVINELNQFVNPLFLFYCFKANWADYIASRQFGSATNYIVVGDLKKFTIPLPPLPEQKRLVTLLDEAFESIATAKANAQQNLKNARALFESHLNEIFAECAKKYGHKTIGEISKHSLGKMLDKAKNKGEFKPYLRNINVRWFNFDLSDTLEMKFLPEETEKYTAVKGDVLICEGGYPGRAAIWQNDEPIYFQKALHRVRFHEIEHNKWFVYFLFSQDSSGSLSQHFTGAGIQHFTGSALKQFKIPIPPIEETKLYVARFDILAEETQRLEALYSRKIAALDELKKALLHRAFSGAL